MEPKDNIIWPSFKRQFNTAVSGDNTVRKAVPYLDRYQQEQLERQQERARQQRRDHRERRVLGRRGDEDHPAVLHPGQKGVLLGLREAVDLVEKEHGRYPVQVSVVEGALHDGAHVFDAGRYR